MVTRSIHTVFIYIRRTIITAVTTAENGLRALEYLGLQDDDQMNEATSNVSIRDEIRLRSTVLSII